MGLIMLIIMAFSLYNNLCPTHEHAPFKPMRFRYLDLPLTWPIPPRFDITLKGMAAPNKEFTIVVKSPIWISLFNLRMGGAKITHYNMPGDNYTVIDYPYKLDDMFYFRLFNNADYLYIDYIPNILENNTYQQLAKIKYPRYDCSDYDQHYLIINGTIWKSAMNISEYSAENYFLN